MGGKNINELLDLLFSSGFICRYSIDGTNYIKILKFLDHQRPHANETPSTIPEPLATMVESTCNHDAKDLLPKSLPLRPSLLNPSLLNPDILIHQKKKSSQKSKPSKPIPIPLPADFCISDGVKSWAKAKGHRNLEAHFEAFVDYVKSKGATYVDWDATFKRAIRENWGKIKDNGESPDDTHYCHKHPDRKAAVSMDGRYYCRDCLRDMDTPPDPESVKRFNDIVAKALEGKVVT